MTRAAVAGLLAMLTGLGLPAGTHVAQAAPAVTTMPAKIVLGEAPSVVTINVRGFEGTGVDAAVNIGDVELVRARGDRVQLQYRLPERRAPQWLCLVLWRRRGRVLVARLPLLGQTTVPIRTRPSSQVTLVIAGTVFGPKASDKRGRLKMRVVVPPGVTSGQVQVVDEVGLTTRKPVTIARPTYNPIAIAMRRSTDWTPRRARFEIIVAAAERTGGALRLRAVDRSGHSQPVAAKVVSAGRWRAHWTAPRPGTWRIVSSLSGASVTASRTVEVAKPPAEPVAQAVPPRVARPTVAARIEHRAPPSRWRWTLGASAGMLHNFGELVSPRFAVEASAAYKLPVGRIGLRLGLGVCWAGQDVVVTPESASTSATTASRVVLVPLSTTLFYSRRFGRLSPYVGVGLVAQIVRASSDGELSGQLVQTEVALAGRWLAGLGVHLGPGELFVQGGYQHSRLSSETVELLAGGLLLDAGFRLWL